jgi:hypothetical protein
LDDIRTFIALSALALACFNFYRLHNLDAKNDYKDKRYLHKDCLDEAKSLLEKIEADLTELQQLRSTLVIRGSSYLGSIGAKDGMTNIVNVVREISVIKDNVKALYLSMDSVHSLGDQEAFDKCIKVSCELKIYYISAIEKLNSAKLMTEQVLECERSHEKNKAYKAFKRN